VAAKTAKTAKTDKFVDPHLAVLYSQSKTAKRLLQICRAKTPFSAVFQAFDGKTARPFPTISSWRPCGLLWARKIAKNS
jgi:hypothetical protein